MKTCSNKNCKMENPQPLTSFHADRGRPDGVRSRCKTCELERAKAYGEKNREKLAEKQRAYYEKNGEIQRNASNNWKRKNKEHISEYMSKWHKENRENRLEYHKQYGQDNPEAALERARKTRAKSFGLNEHFTEEEFKRKFNEMGRKCFYCGIELNDDNVTRDHYIPLTSGGTDTIDNIVPCCHSCNCHKRNKNPEKFILTFGNHEPSRTNGDK